MPNYNDAIEEIKSRCNIVDVIGSVLPLKRNGSTYKACCPFHNEKTPSFVVSEKKQFYHCFGCGESGDAFSFVQKYYNIGFVDAVEKLAASYGVTIEKENSTNSKIKEELYGVNVMAAKHFFNNLKEPGNAGLEYVAKRGLSADTVKDFGIGYAKNEWTDLSSYLKRNKVSANTMVKLGLVSQRKDGSVYDKYRSRLIFPIINTRGKVIGFGGRIIGDGEPKYLNSSESEIFLKKNNLYGLNMSKDAIQQEGYAFLVEGYMDMVSLYQGGVKNVVASLGTALTDNQAKLLHRYCKKVILCYDADAAGIKAALRGIDVLREADMEVKVLHVEGGCKDPDEFVRKYGKDAFLELALKKALNHVDYKVALIQKKYNYKDRDEGIKFLKAVAGVLRTLSPVEQDAYIKDISRRFSVSEDSLRREVELVPKETPEIKGSDNTETKAKTQSKADINLERMIIKLSLINSDYFSNFCKYEGALFSNNALSISSALASLYKKGTDFDTEELKDYLEEEALTYLNEIVNNTPVGNEESAYKDCISKLENKKKLNRIKELDKTIQMLEDLPEDDKRNEELRKVMQEYSLLCK